MRSKKNPAPASKRTNPPKAASYTRTFRKDWDRLSRTGRFDMRKLKQVMLLLIGNDAPLGPEWLDHPLKGNWSGYRECHIGGDFLLVYRLEDDDIVFTRIGTHAELFD